MHGPQSEQQPLCRKLLEKSRKTQHLFLKLYAPGVADKPARALDGHEGIMGDLWMERWMPEYSEWFAIDDRKAMAAQVPPPPPPPKERGPNLPQAHPRARLLQAHQHELLRQSS